jgi:hypothetical protein
MKFITILPLLILSISTYGQSKRLTNEQINKSGAIKLTFFEDLKQAKDLAKADIANGTLFLLLTSGISPKVFATDGQFEEDYNVNYLESGCTGPSKKFAAEYDKVVFGYLTEKNGKKWMRKIRKDVIGFKDFKKERM